MAIPPSMFDAYMGVYGPNMGLANDRRLADYMAQAASAQNLNSALSQQLNAYQAPQSVNPEPNPVLLLLE